MAQASLLGVHSLGSDSLHLQFFAEAPGGYPGWLPMAGGDILPPEGTLSQHRGRGWAGEWAVLALGVSNGDKPSHLQWCPAW